MVMPLDPNATVLIGSTSAPPMIVPLDEQPHTITKVIGISVMCIGGLTILGGLFSFGTIGLNNWLSGSLGAEVEASLLPSWYYASTGLLGMVCGSIFLYSGYLIQTYQKNGIWFTLGSILLQNIVNIGINMSVEFPQGSTEIVEGIDVQMISQVSTVLGSICGMLFCGLFTILPLFFANHGLR